MTLSSNTVKISLSIAMLLLTGGIAWGVSTANSSALEKRVEVVVADVRDLDDRQRESEVTIGSHTQMLNAVNQRLNDIKTTTDNIFNLLVNGDKSSR